MKQWQEILKSVGFPTTALVLDFETYYDTDYSLKKMSTVEYVCDDRFEVLGLGIQELGAPEIGFYAVTEISELLDNFQAIYNFEHCTIIGQNLKFDALILREHFGITPKYTVDIKDLSRHLDARNKHSLEVMAKRHGAPILKGDTSQFKGLHWADMNQEQRQALEKYGKGDVEIETFLFKKLLPLITNPEIELPLTNQTLQLYLNPQVVIDKDLGEDLKLQMQQEMIKPIQQLNAAGISCNQKEISGNKSFVKLLQEHLEPNEQIPMKQGKNKMIPALAKDDEGMHYLKNDHPNPIVRQLAEARTSIKSWPLHIKRIDNLINQANCRNGKIGIPLTYYAAHTGRWGGTEGINPQNLGGRGRGGTGTHPLIQQTRQIFCAPAGYVFGIPDYSQIEARILAWLAGQDDLIESFAAGRSPYAEFATDLFQCVVRKPKESDPGPLKKMLAIKYGFGKDAILGCGYGMGSMKFYDNCRANSNLRPLLDSGEYDWDFIDKLIKTYRRKYSKISEFWKQVEKRWKFVTKYPKEVACCHKLKYEHEKPLLYFYNQNDTTIIQLPSGRCLFYPHAIVTRKDKLKYQWGQLWGGSITENIVQAIARDILAEALLRLETAGFNILFHVHDEVICLFPKFSAEKDLQQMLKLMKVVSDWAQGLPIAVEGELSERYKK